MRGQMVVLIVFAGVMVLSSTAAGVVRLVPGEYTTIQAAINAANNGDEVVIAEGLYEGSGNRNINFNGKAITVRSTDPTDTNVVNATVVDCGLNWSQLSTIRGFIFDSGEGRDSILSGLTIQDGHVLEFGDGGGGIYCDGSSPTISYCVIKDSRLNEFNYGGAGILCRNNSNPKIYKCTLQNNESLGMVDGGAISCKSGSDVVISNCTIRNNSAYLGGGISTRDSNTIIESCLIFDNSAGLRGGGFYADDSNSVINNCTIVKNYTDQEGGGISSRSSSTIISNCIIWDNNSPGAPVNIEHSGPPPIVTYSNIEFGYGGIGNINLNPLFVDSNNNDYHLSADSPCINTGVLSQRQMGQLGLVRG